MEKYINEKENKVSCIDSCSRDNCNNIQLNCGNYTTTLCNIHRGLNDEPRLKCTKSFNVKNNFEKKIKIVTFNIAGVCSLFKKERMKNIYIEGDIIGMQEVDFNIFPKFINNYKFQTTMEKEQMGKINSLCVSNIFPKKYEFYELPGLLDYYNNSVIYLYYDNFIIANIYLQAGSKMSGKIDIKYLSNFHKYREKKLIEILDKVDEIDYKYKIIMGDFNYDLIGNDEDWPEGKIMKRSGFENVLKDKGNECYTEDSENNLLRKITKPNQVKKVQFDSIYYKGFKLSSSKLICKEEFNLDSNGKPMNLSDHYGVEAEFEF